MTMNRHTYWQPVLGQAATLGDRLVAALEATVICDRWVANSPSRPDNSPHQGWQEGFLRVTQACASGKSLSQGWGTHFQALPSTAVVLVNALPYLWMYADAQGHHRQPITRWIATLGLSAAAAEACDKLFGVLCQTRGHYPLFQREFSLAKTSPVGLNQALDLVAQSQGQVAIAVRVAQQQGWTSAEIALASWLSGLIQGRASLGSRLRQQWLLEYRPAALDPWQGVDGDSLTALATALHHRWAGRGPIVAPVSIRV
ncbi:hypothetical protein IQ254_25990 [Nodosilinea sp. LEGE 07088]|uniref:hypothetical protein n=1 Tax=Nodosilinea sp. LEGE 07088 TaxID=2777968 RepID=UPI00188103EF|nr:hypothetical protein [Nodosilinea sp. LEGE 07088]MBE9140611.1 hypothetical protein [Nodosilinea sp. LEGE 07088]